MAWLYRFLNLKLKIFLKNRKIDSQERQEEINQLEKKLSLEDKDRNSGKL